MGGLPQSRRSVTVRIICRPCCAPIPLYEVRVLDIITFRRRFSQNTLFRMLLLAIAIAGIIYWKLDLINTVYFKDQLTTLGLVINGSIVVLFAVGLLKMISIFLGYSREEAAVARFIRNQEDENQEDPLHGVPPRSIIGRRYRTMKRLFDSHSVVTQSALAATLLASESTRTSLPKFINNILILTGVFGTIVSLSIALLGASDLLENAVNVGGMGLVIHGMSTALSTTITAILCYLYFGYFYLKLTDAQTNLISAVEQTTTTYLVPEFQLETESVLYEFTGLVRSLQTLVNHMDASQKALVKVEEDIMQTLEKHPDRLQELGDNMDSIKAILRQGFRLQDE